MAQLSMTTQDRLQLLTGTVHPLNASSDSLDFQVVPNIVLLQQYTPGNVYNVMINIRNISKVIQF